MFVARGRALCSIIPSHPMLEDPNHITGGRPYVQAIFRLPLSSTCLRYMRCVHVHQPPTSRYPVSRYGSRRGVIQWVVCGRVAYSSVVCGVVVVGACVLLGESDLGLGMRRIGDVTGAMNGRVAWVDC